MMSALLLPVRPTVIDAFDTAHQDVIGRMSDLKSASVEPKGFLGRF